MVLFTLFSKGTEIVIDLSVFVGRKLYNVVYNWMYPEESIDEILNRIESELVELRKQNNGMIEMISIKKQN
jgi:hypothetical protein